MNKENEPWFIQVYRLIIFLAGTPRNAAAPTTVAAAFSRVPA
jgi:hypothetical protein